MSSNDQNQCDGNPQDPDINVLMAQNLTAVEQKAMHQSILDTEQSEESGSPAGEECASGKKAFTTETAASADHEILLPSAKSSLETASSFKPTPNLLTKTDDNDGDPASRSSDENCVEETCYIPLQPQPDSFDGGAKPIQSVKSMFFEDKQENKRRKRGMLKGKLLVLSDFLFLRVFCFSLVSLPT